MALYDTNSIVELARLQQAASTEQVVSMWRQIKAFAQSLWLAQGHLPEVTKAIHTKFNDAGRRSAPWRAFSNRTPGRPQDGADGNRINRWLMPVSHKFYATEKDATLVQIRYYLQALSMTNAPETTDRNFRNAFYWLAGHAIVPGEYLDPIQLIPIDMNEFFSNPRSVTSGHLIPLDRAGKHEPKNAFLMLHRSNQLQGNLTLEELIELMNQIVIKHRLKKQSSGS
jgi:hypothetical protein